MPEIVIPYRPREQFRPLHERKERWASIVAHRRCGKTVACINDLIRDALTLQKEAPRYAYIGPTYQQVKDVAWGYLKRYAAPLPGTTISESELSITFANGGRIRLYGAENYDRIRGLYLDGCVIDEPADIDPRAWPEVIRPALSDRQGRATFIGTPKGRNWFHTIHTAAQDDPNWLALTLRASETGLLPESELDDLRKMLTEDQYAQELECSFDAAIKGAYYGKLMQLAENDGRVCSVAYEPTARVWTAWDLGVSDHTSIWFCQLIGREIRIIDYYEASGEALSHYVNVIDKKGYVYGGHLLPHDVEARELGTGKTRREVLEGLNLKVLTVPQHSVEDGISAVRAFLPRCWFDKVKTARGVECLTMYRADYDDKLQTLRSRPVHDWASHGCLIAGEKVETTRGLVNVENVAAGDYVWTPSGISLVKHAGPVKIADRLIEVTTGKGQVLTCTPEHKILTARGFVPASSLTTLDRILTGLEWNARLIGFVSKVTPIGFRAAITGEMSGDQRVHQTFTGRFTSRRMGLFQTVTKFITETVGRSTTTPQTSIAYQCTTTSASTCLSDGRAESYRPRPSWHYSAPLSGIVQTKVTSGTASTVDVPGTIGSGLKRLVRSALSRFARLILRAPSSATRIAKLRHLECGEGGTLVFDLTVEKNACYRANGLLVSNSDAFRYLAMGLDYFAGIDLPKAKDRYRDRRDSQTSASWMSA